ncbi:MAG: hypothetical protein ACAI35_06830 [Candidatus Methylacidiphilales bacterium]|nr:hypothetical protein [Candidatus Methylacidiphilales bacterium]
MKYCIALLVLLSVQCAFARLGENLDECKARYGMFAKQGQANVAEAKFYVFQKKGIDVNVIIWKNKCVSISYTKSGGGGFTPTEVDLLQHSNAENQTWTSEEKDGMVNYTRKDKKAEGYHEKDPVKTISFVYVEYANEEKARAQGRETGLEGF